MKQEDASAEYRELLLERGIAIPWHTLRDLDMDLLCQSGVRDVAAAVRHGVFDSQPGPILILPPVREVLSAVRDEALRIGLEKGQREGWCPFALVLEGLAARSGIDLGTLARDASEWFSGHWWGKTHPMDGFTHIARSPLDPERESREERRKKFGKSAASEWKKLTGGCVDAWRRLISRILADGEPRTFNAIMLEASEGTHTADVAHAKDPDKALWSLVEEGAVEHTSEVPIFFRKTC